MKELNLCSELMAKISGRRVVIANFEYVQLFSLISVNLMSRFEDGGTWVDKAMSDGLAHLLPGHL